MTKFKSTRDQVVDGKSVKAGATIEVEADRVKYLVARGYLVKAEEAPKKSTSKSKKAD